MTLNAWSPGPTGRVHSTPAGRPASLLSGKGQETGGSLKARNDVRRRCEAELRRLDVPRPFDLAALCERMTLDRGRPVLVHRVPFSLGPCGWWVATVDADHIHVQAGSSALHEQLIILHELSHILMGHSGDSALADLFPLTSHSASKMLARTVYDQVQEQEAELLASLILADAGWENENPVVKEGVSIDAALVVGRLAEAFDSQSVR